MASTSKETCRSVGPSADMPLDLTEKETCHQFGHVSLIIPEHIDKELELLDKTIAARAMAAEMMALGITIPVNSNTDKVVEVCIPQQIFNFDALFINQYEDGLFNLLTEFQDIHLKIDGGSLVISCPTRPVDPVILDDDFSYQLCKSQLEKLVSVKELPKDFIEAIKIISVLCNDQIALTIPNNYECIVKGNAATMSPHFFMNAQLRALEFGGRIGFTVHHHPALALMRMLPPDQMHDIYKKVLHYSDVDLTTHQNFKIPFFEIRMFGNPENPADSDAGVTRIIYAASDQTSTEMLYRQKTE